MNFQTSWWSCTPSIYLTHSPDRWWGVRKTHCFDVLIKTNVSLRNEELKMRWCWGTFYVKFNQHDIVFHCTAAVRFVRNLSDDSEDLFRRFSWKKSNISKSDCKATWDTTSRCLWWNRKMKIRWRYLYSQWAADTTYLLVTRLPPHIKLPLLLMLAIYFTELAGWAVPPTILSSDAGRNKTNWNFTKILFLITYQL